MNKKNVTNKRGFQLGNTLQPTHRDPDGRFMSKNDIKVPEKTISRLDRLLYYEKWEKIIAKVDIIDDVMKELRGLENYEELEDFYISWKVRLERNMQMDVCDLRFGNHWK